jgi:hypothetical protein
MNLKDFIRQTLIEIAEGVEASHEAVRTAGGQVAYTKGLAEVKFDVAVTTIAKDEASGKGGIKVMGIGVGGEIGDSRERSEVSRIQFGVWVDLPASDKRKRRSFREDQAKARGRG